MTKTRTLPTRQCSAASDMDLHCLPLSHKKDSRLILVNEYFHLRRIVSFNMLVKLILDSIHVFENTCKLKSNGQR